MSDGSTHAQAIAQYVDHCRYDLTARRHMTDPTVAAETCVALGATDHQFEAFPGRDIGSVR